MSKFNFRRSFRMEQLEDRRLMAGDVLAMVNTEGTLVLLEAGNSVGGPQSVWVQPAGNGTVEVLGITSPANTSGSVIRDAAGRDLASFNRMLQAPKAVFDRSLSTLRRT